MKYVNIADYAQFQPKQLIAYNYLLDDQVKYLLYGGAAGGGKSYFLRWSAAALGMMYYQQTGQQNIPIGLFSEDYPTLRDRQIVKIGSEFPKWLGEVKEHKIWGFAFVARPKYGGWVIMLRNLDDPSKYSSVEFAAILVEELTKNTRKTFDDLRSRMRFPGIKNPKFVAATNPGEIGHGWVKSLWIKPDPRDLDVEHENFFFVPARVVDNKHIDVNYQKQLLAIKDPQKRRALMDGDWDIFEGQVFAEWRDRLHVNPNFAYPPDMCRKIMCFDWGYNDPGCMLWIAFAPENVKGVAHAYVYRELYQNKKSPEEWARDLKVITQTEKVEYLVLPHDCFYKLGGRTSIATIFQKELGIPIIPGRTLQKEARKNRVAVTHNWLAMSPDGRPYLQVHPRANNLIRTLPELVYDPNHTEDVDTRGDDHAYDALSLGLFSWAQIAGVSGAVAPQKPIKQGTQIRHWQQDQSGNIMGVDFLEHFKEQAGQPKATSWEYK